MSEWLRAALALPAGTLVGVVHFYGLRLTTDRLPRARRPVLFATGSFLLRSFAVAAVLFWVSGDRWENWALALGGLLLGRMFVMHRTVQP